MKKSHKETWLAALAVVALGAGGVFAYEKWYAATTIAPGAISLVTPSSGNITLALPSGAKGWASANLISTGAATQPGTPTSPTTHFNTAVSKGAVLTIAWTDSNGSPAVSIITFT